VRDEIDGVEPRHVLLFEEVGRVALALGEDGDEHVGTRNLFLTGRLHMDHGALDHALEGSRRPRVLPVGHHETVELFVDEILEVGLQRFDVDVATGQHRDGVAIVGQGQQQVLQGRELMGPFAGQVHRLMEGLLKSAGERGHMSVPIAFPSRTEVGAGSCGPRP
jgi:hypothetical protein